MVYKVSILKESVPQQKEIMSQVWHTVPCHICKDEWVVFAGLFLQNISRTAVIIACMRGGEGLCNLPGHFMAHKFYNEYTAFNNS